MADVDIYWNEIELDAVLRGPTGPVARRMVRYGEIVTQGAKRRAPVSPHGSAGRPSGYLRSKIGWRMGRDSLGLYVDISSPARTPQGEPLGLFMEVGTRPHVIRPLRPGGWLRWVSGGRVHFAQIVHHPGTSPQPHLRPALEDLRGA